jgi:shikimate kinase
MRIYLIGFMGSGKTTAGKKLAHKLGFEFMDLDQMIESKCKVSITTLFEKYDEHVFRILEHETLAETAAITQAVIATGGGTPCFYDNLNWMKVHGITIYLQLEPGTLNHRLQASRKVRPLLKGKADTEIQAYVITKLAERESYYRQADITVKGENLDMNYLLSEIKNVIKTSNV